MIDKSRTIRRLKGPARALRHATFRRGEHHALSREAEEALFEHAEILNEGSVEGGREGGGGYCGSTMLTFDLDAMAGRMREPMSDDHRGRICSAVEGSVRVRLRAMRLACAEAARRVPELALGTALVETRVRLVGGMLHLDVDLEVPFELSSQREQR